jgi:hypothetical protein
LLTNTHFACKLSSVEDLDPLLADQEDLHLTNEEKKEAELSEQVEYQSSIYTTFENSPLLFHIKFT